jgi:hypothetical protein
LIRATSNCLAIALARAANAPVGQITDLPVQPLLQKYSDFPKKQISL